VALALRNGRFLDSEATRDELLRTTTTTDQANIVTEHQRLRSDPRLANHSLAVNAFLPDGKALAFVTSAGLESRVVFVRQTGVTPPPTVSLPEDLKRVTSRSATMLVRTDGVNLPQVQVDPRPEMPHLLNPWRSLDDGNPLVLAAIGRSWTVDAQAVLGHSGEDYETLDLGAYVALMGSTRESIERAIARFLQNAPVPQSLAVTLTLRRGTREPAALARAVVPLRVGVPSVVVVGRESVADLVASPEVATGSSGIDTEIGRLFDGIAVSVALGAGAGGTLTLVVDAHARWSRVAPRDFESGGAISARLQLPDADMLDVRRTVVLAKADGGPRKVTLGNAGTSAEALTLDVEVVDLR
jgi:hypothetical protein